MPKQLSKLRGRPRIIVGTPGRINDHLRRKSLRLDNASFLVLDETDRMLDMGFTIQIEEIMKYMPQKRQTLLFSATLPNNITKIAEKYLCNPVRIAVDKKAVLSTNIQQEVIKTSEADKYSQLLVQLNQREGSIIGICKN